MADRIGRNDGYQVGSRFRARSTGSGLTPGCGTTPRGPPMPKAETEKAIDGVREHLKKFRVLYFHIRFCDSTQMLLGMFIKTICKPILKESCLYRRTRMIYSKAIQVFGWNMRTTLSGLSHNFPNQSTGTCSSSIYV